MKENEHLVNFLWKAYFCGASLTFLIKIINAAFLSINLNQLGTSETIKVFWLYPSPIYLGFLLVSITAYFRWQAALWIGVYLLYPVMHLFYAVLIGSNGSLVGISAWLLYTNTIFSFLTEITCLLLIFLYWKTKLGRA